MYIELTVLAGEYEEMTEPSLRAKHKAAGNTFSWWRACSRMAR